MFTNLIYHEKSIIHLVKGPVVMPTQYLIGAVGTEHPLEVLYNILKINSINMGRENFMKYNRILGTK